MGVAVNDHGPLLSAMGAASDNYDNDGRPDILFTALTGETFPLFRSTPQGFVDVTYPTRLGLASARRSGWGVVLADLNNDGWKDIATANSHVTDKVQKLRSEKYLGPNLVLLNEGGRFGQAVELGAAAAHRGLAAANLDGDRMLDLITTVPGGQAILWHNVTPGAGNVVSVEAPHGSRVRAGAQTKYAYTATAYVSSVAGPLHFGLGRAEMVDSEITLSNGKVGAYKQVKAGALLKVVE